MNMNFKFNLKKCPVLTPELDDSPEVVIKKKDILTPHLAATLDRIGLSDRNAIYVITAVLDALDLNLGM